MAAEEAEYNVGCSVEGEEEGRGRMATRACTYQACLLGIGGSLTYSGVLYVDTLAKMEIMSHS